MNEYYYDMMLLGIKPFALLHRLGVNGKQPGSLAAIHEIPNAVTVMYGPQGCGFLYRNYRACPQRSGGEKSEEK